MRNRHGRFVTCSLLSAILLLSACSKKGTTAAAGTQKSSAASSSSHVPLPTAPLGALVTHFLGNGGMPDTKSAKEGVDSQVQLHREYNPLKNDDTFALLTQFGTILQIHIPDMLNRSTDRAGTLNQYIDALKNITVRAQRTADDLTNHAAALHTQDQKQQSDLSTLQRQLDTAKRGNDFATATTAQKDITALQAKIGDTRSQEQQTKDLITTYQNLIDISKKRQDAIDKNREVLIAGLQIVNIPGVENIGVIQGTSSRGIQSLFQGL